MLITTSTPALFSSATLDDEEANAMLLSSAAMVTVCVDAPSSSVKRSLASPSSSVITMLSSISAMASSEISMSKVPVISPVRVTVPLAVSTSFAGKTDQLKVAGALASGTAVDSTVKVTEPPSLAVVSLPLAAKPTVPLTSLSVMLTTWVVLLPSSQPDAPVRLLSMKVTLSLSSSTRSSTALISNIAVAVPVGRLHVVPRTEPPEPEGTESV